ncbi:MAG: amidohydrolase family protein, partial [Mailhella sp.]|nr:amidohydrolase family protein [Mailhella sp.]
YQALQAYTTHAALCCLSENDRGALKAGYYADMVVLERDIEKIAPETIIDTKICMTVCGGKIVYKA